MKNVIRFISACVVGALIGLGVSTIIGHFLTTTGKANDVHKLDMKFGVPPSHPEYYPIVHLADKTGRPFCTAFVIDAHYAATAGHCIATEGSMFEPSKMKTETYKFLDEKNVDLNTEVKPVGFDEWTDYGLLLRGF